MLAHERADGPAGDAAHDLAEQEALVVDVIGGARAGLPQRLLHFERLHISLAVEQAAGPHRIVGEHGTAAR